MSTRSCPSCAEELPAQAVFCLKCGAQQDRVAAEQPQARTGWVPKLRSGTRWRLAYALLFIAMFALVLATPQPTAETLIPQVDAAWSNGDWPGVISTLEKLQRVAPSALNFRDKMYAAHYNYGKTLVDSGKWGAAIEQFRKANQVDPSRGEANAELQILSPPTPTPGPPQRIEAIAKKVLGKDFRSVEMGSPVYPIVNANMAEIFGNLEWSAGSTADRFVDVARQVFAIPEIEVMTFSVYTTLVDTYGKETDGRIAYLNITRATANKVNWSNFDSHNVNRLLKGDGDAVALINLEFRKAWNEFQNK